MTQTRPPGQKAGTQRPARPEPRRSAKLTGRGAVIALFASSCVGLLITARTGWSAFADVLFVLTCILVACYTRASGLRGLVVCPPLAFCAGSVLAQVLTAPDGFSAAEGILVTLGSSAPWLFTGTVLTVAIALGRGYRPRVPDRSLPGHLRAAGALRPLRPLRPLRLFRPFRPFRPAKRR